jgi:hypothetical protein
VWTSVFEDVEIPVQCADSFVSVFVRRNHNPYNATSPASLTPSSCCVGSIEVRVQNTAISKCVTLHTISAFAALSRSFRVGAGLEEIGRDSYQLQIYYLTHLTFIMSHWGAVLMEYVPTPFALASSLGCFLMACGGVT